MGVTLSRKQVREVDRIAMARYGIPGAILMENAARNAAELIDANFGPCGRCVIFSGPGNNGGDGCVIARHLHNAGWSVRLALCGDAERMTDDTKMNHAIVLAMGLQNTLVRDEAAQDAFARTIRSDEVVIDALLGTGFTGTVRSPTDVLIAKINGAARRATVAIDVPSGLDCDTGSASNATIRADLTITFVARKKGFAAAGAYVGRVEVVDIGAPRGLIEEVLAGGE